MSRVFSNGVVLFASMLWVPATVTNPERPCVFWDYRSDPRFGHLQRFFERRDCPAQQYLEEFLRVADTYHLDWRLLPSLSLVESGGGRDAKNNNLFGWDGGRASFRSIDAGIHKVASRLAHSRIYKDKGLDQLLATYNPKAKYPAVVKSVMRRIAPSE